MTASPGRNREGLDWLSEFFSDTRQKARRERLRAAWEASRDFLMGVHETLLDEITAEDGDPAEAFDHVLSAYLNVLVEQLAAEADERLDWRRVERAEIRAWLEKHDGPFIRRVLTVARMTAAHKRTRKPASRLLALLPGPVSRIEQHSEGSAVEATAVEAVDDGPSAPTVIRRLDEIVKGDRHKTRPADLPNPRNLPGGDR